MNETVAAGVEADVLDAVHEDEIAGPQAPTGDTAAEAELRSGVMRQPDAEFAVDVLDEPGAVKAVREAPP